MSFKEKLLTAIQELETKLIEREELIRLTLLCIFAKHHMFLIGKPGVGKTYAIQTISKIINDGSYWEILMTKETEERQLVGTENTPKEQTLLVHPFIFFDEMFKATDELLVALLALLNERRWTIGGKGIPVPLNSLFSASNELPFGEKIEPFSDRILIWYEVQRIQKRENKENYIRAKFNRSKENSVSFSMKEIAEVQELCDTVEIGDEVLDSYLRIQSEMLNYNIKASDRKFGPDFIVRALKVCAILNDRKELNFSDLLLLKHMSWTTYDERTKSIEVVNNVIFGNEELIERQLFDINVFFAEAFAYYDSKCFNFINFQVEYSLALYKSCYGYCKDFYKKAQIAYDSLNNVFAHYNHAMMILKQAEENIFIIKIKNFPFTQNILEKMQKLLLDIEFQLKKTKSFLEAYDDDYKYQEELFKKNYKS